MPIMNILTNELQCAYENNKSAHGIIAYLKHEAINSKLKGLIIFDLGKNSVKSIEENYGGYYI